MYLLYILIGVFFGIVIGLPLSYALIHLLWHGERKDGSALWDSRCGFCEKELKKY